MDSANMVPKHHAAAAAGVVRAERFVQEPLGIIAVLYRIAYQLNMKTEPIIIFIKRIYED